MLHLPVIYQAVHTWIINDLILFDSLKNNTLLLTAFAFLPIDAYARVAFCKQSAVTAVLTQTLCPTWDQTLIFDEIEIYEGVENVAKNPPSVVVELFDRDSVVRSPLVMILHFCIRNQNHNIHQPSLINRGIKNFKKRRFEIYNDR